MLCRRNEIDLCARLLGVSAVGLNANPGLVVFAVLIKIVEGVFVLPIFGLIFTSYTNGEVVPNGVPLSLLEYCVFSSSILTLSTSVLHITWPKILGQLSWLAEEFTEFDNESLSSSQATINSLWCDQLYISQVDEVLTVYSSFPQF